MSEGKPLARSQSFQQIIETQIWRLNEQAWRLKESVAAVKRAGAMARRENIADREKLDSMVRGAYGSAQASQKKIESV